MPQNIGVYGLDVLGTSYALKLEASGLTVAVGDAEPQRMEAFIAQHKGRSFVGVYTPEDLCKAVRPHEADTAQGEQSPSEFASPARSQASDTTVIVFLFVESGDLDALLDRMSPELRAGDLLVDCGDSFYKRTSERANKLLKHHGVRLCDLGVAAAGGPQGGFAFMVGGDLEASVAHLMPLLRRVAATYRTRELCDVSVAGSSRSEFVDVFRQAMAYCGTSGAGQCAKMVYDGIEQGILELVSEAVVLLSGQGLGNDAIAEFFELLDKEFPTHFFWAASQVLRLRNDFGEGVPKIPATPLEQQTQESPNFQRPHDIDPHIQVSPALSDSSAALATALTTEKESPFLIDGISDIASWSLAGRHCVEAGLRLGACVSLIGSGVSMREFSAGRLRRLHPGCDCGAFGMRNSEKHAQEVPHPPKVSESDFCVAMRKALLLALVMVYHQGFELLRCLCEESQYRTDLVEVCNSWKAGGALRSVLLEDFLPVLREGHSILESPHVQEKYLGLQGARALALVCSEAFGKPCPAFLSAMAYGGMLHADVLPTRYAQGFQGAIPNCKIGIDAELEEQVEA